MIETLHGIQETVNFKENSNIRLYYNEEVEDYPRHWHSPIEIIMPVQNHYRAICNNITYDIKEGDILIISPGVIHSLEAPATGNRFIFLADYSIIRSIKELEPIISSIAPAFLITPENAPVGHARIREHIYAIADEYFSDAPLYQAAIYARLLEIFVCIARECSPSTRFEVSTSKQKEYVEKFSFICEYINEHCTENITLDETAQLAGFSKFHFSRLFKSFTNVSFYKYVNQKRIAFAENLLIDPTLSVTEVALRSGFESLSSFIRMFKIVKGVTPTEFKAMYTP